MDIKEGMVYDKNQRSFDLPSNTPIYAYVISDLMKNLHSFTKQAAYKVLPDNDGYFAFNPNYDMYISLIF